VSKEISANVVFVTNIPAPYREKLHEELSVQLNNRYTVLYCSNIELNRKWKFKLGDYNKIFLPVKTISFFNRFIHLNRNVIRELNRINPDVVITGGFGTSMLSAFLWSKVKKKKHIPFTDGTIDSEKKLSFLHKFLRKLIFSYSNAFIGASNKSIDLYLSYGVEKEDCFKSVLFIDNKKFDNNQEKKEFDVMFSGQFIDRKLPLFFLDVVKRVQETRGSCRALILGDGPLKEEMLSANEKFNIDFEYPGFVQQDNLPAMYEKCKIFLFTTLNDPWGVVANEACASGLPVITTPYAGCANELVVHNKNGYVLEINVEEWALKVIELLDNKEKYQDYSLASKKMVKNYNYKKAVDGVCHAIAFSRN
jgi:glycosyltransferase involved in cell wall biosynthesis